MVAFNVVVYEPSLQVVMLRNLFYNIYNELNLILYCNRISHNFFIFHFI